MRGSTAGKACLLACALAAGLITVSGNCSADQPDSEERGTPPLSAEFLEYLGMWESEEDWSTDSSSESGVESESVAVKRGASRETAREESR